MERRTARTQALRACGAHSMDRFIPYRASGQAAADGGALEALVGAPAGLFYSAGVQDGPSQSASTATGTPAQAPQHLRATLLSSPGVAPGLVPWIEASATVSRALGHATPLGAAVTAAGTGGTQSGRGTGSAGSAVGMAGWVIGAGAGAGGALHAHLLEMEVGRGGSASSGVARSPHSSWQASAGARAAQSTAVEVLQEHASAAHDAFSSLGATSLPVRPRTEGFSSPLTLSRNASASCMAHVSPLTSADYFSPSRTTGGMVVDNSSAGFALSSPAAASPRTGAPAALVSVDHFGEQTLSGIAAASRLLASSHAGGASPRMLHFTGPGVQEDGSASPSADVRARARRSIGGGAFALRASDVESCDAAENVAHLSRAPDNALAPSVMSPPRGSRAGGLSARPASRLTPTRSAIDLARATMAASVIAPLSGSSRELLGAARHTRRTISRAPHKVLDAPGLADDFYLNLLDWSSQNVLSVGLRPDVYLWHASTGAVAHLATLPAGATTCSLRWTQEGGHVAVGASDATVHLYDATTRTLLRTLNAHQGRVSSLAWAGSTLASAGRTGDIYIHDVRTPQEYELQLRLHKHEVCGLAWSPDWCSLASGGNDNRLAIWSLSGASRASSSSIGAAAAGDEGVDGHGGVRPPLVIASHKAAVKALAWSPHHAGLIASGGGSHDKHIRFHSAVTGEQISALDVGAQVTQLAWSPTANELLSTQGFTQNSLVLWKYPTMTRAATLLGHSSRVLYLAAAPDGETVVTGAGDDTLRFWKVFDSCGEDDDADTPHAAAAMHTPLMSSPQAARAATISKLTPSSLSPFAGIR